MRQFIILIAAALALQANADCSNLFACNSKNYLDMEPLTLEKPEMKAELVDFETGPETTVDWDPRH